MKIKDTLSLEDKQRLYLLGIPVGIFEALFDRADPFYEYAHNMCLEYYTIRSANKTVSPLYENFIDVLTELGKNLGEQITEAEAIAEVNRRLGLDVIRPKYIDKWTRVYTSLTNSQYDPLKSYEYSEHKEGSNSDVTDYDTKVNRTGNNSDTTTFDTQLQKIGDNTDTITFDSQLEKTGDNTDTVTHNTTEKKLGENTDKTIYDTSLEDTGETGNKQTTTTSKDNTGDVYGFNSNSPVGDTAETENTTETVEGSAEDNTTHNVQAKTGTEQKAVSIDESVAKTGTDTTNILVDEKEIKTGTDTKNMVVDETETKTGTDTKNMSINETETKSGSDTKNFKIDEDITKSGRDVAGADLIKAEIDLRIRQIFFDIVYRDIDSVATIPLYI